MNAVLLQQFAHRVAARIGLQIREQDYKNFAAVLERRQHALAITSSQEYLDLLRHHDHPQGVEEWDRLAIELTTGESYFFRDQGQFAALKEDILPELIARREGVLRIWSAGCSTGEEPYSIAMLLDELCPKPARRISILGTDINRAALEKARKGVYRDWSLRVVPAQVKARYFHQQGGSWRIREDIREMVTFRAANLLQDPFPSNVLADMHLIVCRNVFIYFAPDAAARVIGKFARTLCRGGYLITGHNETAFCRPEGLQPKMLCGGMVWQRMSQPSTPVVTATEPAAEDAYRVQAVSSVAVSPVGGASVASRRRQTPAPQTRVAPAPVREDTSRLLDETRALLQKGRYAAAVDKASRIEHGAPQYAAALYLSAQAYANMGETARAAQYCRRAIAGDRLAREPYYLMAHIAQEQEDRATAVTCYNRILYLDPGCIAAYLELSELHAQDEPGRA